MTRWATAATTKVVIKTSPTASSEIALQVRPEVAPGGKERRDVEQRRQEQQEHDVGLQLDLRQPRHEAERRASEDLAGSGTEP